MCIVLFERCDSTNTVYIYLAVQWWFVGSDRRKKKLCWQKLQKLYIPPGKYHPAETVSFVMFRFRKCVSQPEMVSRMFLSYHTHNKIPPLLFSLIINLLFVLCVWYSQRTKVFLFVGNFFR
jgi:hypothetical protein